MVGYDGYNRAFLQGDMGPSIEYVTLFLMIFDPPPLSQTVANLDPVKVCHTSEQKVNEQISRMETALNNYNRYYYILNNNKRPYWVFLINHEIPLITSLISYNSEGDSCSLNL